MHIFDAGAVTVVDLEKLIVDVDVQTVVVTTPAPDPAVQELRDVLAEEVDLPELGRDVRVERPVRAVRILERAVEARHHDDAPARVVRELDESGRELRLDDVVALVSEAPLRVSAREAEADLLAAL